MTRNDVFGDLGDLDNLGDQMRDAGLIFPETEPPETPLPEPPEVPDVPVSVCDLEAGVDDRRMPDWTSGLLKSQRGGILAVVANAIHGLTQDAAWSGVIAYDQFAERANAVMPTPWGKLGPWSDTDDIRLAEWFQHRYVMVSPLIASQAVQAVAVEHPFHPVKQYLDSLEWDRSPRIDTWLMQYLGASPNGCSDADETALDDNGAYISAVGSRWLISAVARVMQPGCKADHCLILEGETGIKKSTALEVLASKPWFADEIAVIGTKDAAQDLPGKWIIELAELDAMRRVEASAIKAFMSRSTDHYRPSYGRRSQDFHRQCVFAGTVNHYVYLQDETGGRRFWPVRCGTIDIDALARDRDQIWAEAYARYKAGYPWYLETIDLARQATREQSHRYQQDPWTDRVMEWARVRPDISVLEVLTDCLKIDVGRLAPADGQRVGRILVAAGWERFRKRYGDRLEWRYQPPETQGVLM